MKTRLSEYAAIQAELADVEAENERLREIIDKKEDLRAFEPDSCNGDCDEIRINGKKRLLLIKAKFGWD